MSIYTIRAGRLITFVLAGHSRADGWGQSDYLFSQHTDFLPRNGADVRVDTANCFWKDIFVATSPQPFPGTSHTPTAADVGDVEWLELTIANVDNNGDAHPHAHPYNYPNNRGSCYPRYFYNAWIFSGFDGFHHNYRQEYSFNYKNEASGPFQPGEMLDLAGPVGPNRQARLLSLTDNGATGSMTVELVSGLPPADTTQIGGITSGATADVDGVVTAIASKINGTLVGLEIPFSFYWRNYHASQVGMVKVAFSSTLLLPFNAAGSATDPWLDPNLGLAGMPASTQTTPTEVTSAVNTSLGGFNAYWTPAEQFDWSPATERIYKLWYDKMVGAQAALPSGTKMDVRLIIPWFGDNDAASRSAATLRSSFKDAVRQIVSKMRSACADNDWSTLPADQIPVVIPGIGPGYAGATAAADGLDAYSFCNGAIQELAADDPYMRWVDTAEWLQLSDETEAPPLGMGAGTTHESANGYVQAATDVMAAYRDIVEQSMDAIPAKDRITLQEAMDMVRGRYSRGLTDSDLDDDVLTEQINNAIRTVVNHAGDSCWWLNRRIEMSLTFASDGVCSLPLHVARALWIEDPNDPRASLPFEQIGFGDGGRCQIVFTDGMRGTTGTGTYRVRHIGWPLPVTKPSQELPIPRQIIEWVVVEACMRLASGSTDVSKTALLSGEARALQERCMRQLGAQQRQARDALHAEQPRIRLRY